MNYLDAYREGLIASFDQKALVSEEKKASQVLKSHTETSGFIYTENHYRNLLSVRSFLIHDLYVRARRADSVMQVFRAAPKSIRNNADLLKIYHHLDISVYIAGSRMQRMSLLKAQVHKPTTRPKSAAALPNLRRTTQSSAQQKVYWDEEQEKHEVRRLMEDLTITTHALLVGIAREDIIDDLGLSNEKRVTSGDPFFRFADLFARWTLRYIADPFDKTLVNQIHLLSNKDAVGFYSAVLYAEDAMRLARSFQVPGSMGPNKEDPEMGLVNTGGGDLPKLPSMRSLLTTSVGSRGLSFNRHQFASSSIVQLRLALEEALNWFKSVDAWNADEITRCRNLSWRLSQHSCTLKRELEASNSTGTVMGIGSLIFSVVTLQSDFGDTLTAIKDREKASMLADKQTPSHYRLLHHMELPVQPSKTWRVDGLTYLGPFGLMEVTKLGVSTMLTEGTYHVNLASVEPRKLKIYQEQFGDKLQGRLGAMDKITLQTKLDIARYHQFCWAYPLDGMTEHKVRTCFEEFEKRQLPFDATDYFFLNGAYFYFIHDATSSPALINSLYTGVPHLLFSEPRPLPKEWSKDESKWGDITLDMLRTHGARKFRWLTPTEAKKLSGSSAFHGGFAYMYDNPETNNYFLLFEPPKIERVTHSLVVQEVHGKGLAGGAEPVAVEPVVGDEEQEEEDLEEYDGDEDDPDQVEVGMDA